MCHISSNYTTTKQTFDTHFTLYFNAIVEVCRVSTQISVCISYLSKGIRTSYNMEDNIQKNCEEHNKSEQQPNDKSEEKTEKEMLEKASKPYPYCVICKTK